MASISDELTGRVLDDAPGKVLRAAGEARNAAKGTAELTSKAVNGILSGIVLIYKGGKFTTEHVMDGIGKKIADNGGNIGYSPNNVSLGELYESGGVSRIDETVSRDVMKYFNKHCVKQGIKYSVMKDSDKDTYYLFFNSKQLDSVKTIIEQSYKDYMQDKAKAEERGKNRDGTDKKKDGRRESVLAKLRKYQKAAKERDADDGRDHMHNRSDRSR